MSLVENLKKTPYHTYTYSYPHKLAYRPFAEKMHVDDLWEEECLDHLFLYLHIPFCSSHCSYCNLFSLHGDKSLLMEKYLSALKSHLLALGTTRLSAATFSQIAIGGGTPTLMSRAQFESLLGMVRDTAGGIPLGIEVSPETATPGKLSLLKEHDASRISVGIQSFDDGQLKYFGRRHTLEMADACLTRIRDLGFSTLNIDLIYGGRNFNLETWRKTLQSAMVYRPEEIYLYPLYIRVDTGLYSKDRSFSDNRVEAYKIARDYLLSNGYVQYSLRCFRLERNRDHILPEYTCQNDGMVGLGCGARSYTEHVHYAAPYASRRADVEKIIMDYANRDRDEFRYADFGYVLDEKEKMIRWLLKTLFRTEGLLKSDFEMKFHRTLEESFPLIEKLEEEGLADSSGDLLKLTETGIELSDAIGPLFYSEDVKSRMGEIPL